MGSNAPYVTWSAKPLHSVHFSQYFMLSGLPYLNIQYLTLSGLQCLNIQYTLIVTCIPYQNIQHTAIKSLRLFDLLKSTRTDRIVRWHISCQLRFLSKLRISPFGKMLRVDKSVLVQSHHVFLKQNDKLHMYVSTSLVESTQLTWNCNNSNNNSCDIPREIMTSSWR